MRDWLDNEINIGDLIVYSRSAYTAGSEIVLATVLDLPAPDKIIVERVRASIEGNITSKDTISKKSKPYVWKSITKYHPSLEEMSWDDFMTVLKQKMRG